MDQIKEFADDRQKSWCIHCGGWIEQYDTNRDHVPSKAFLHKPYPENLPVVEICKSCNKGFSPDEEYLIAFLGSVLAGSTDLHRQSHPTAARVLQRNSALRAKIEHSKTAYETRGGETKFVWRPELDRINRIAIKNARGHAYYEFGEPMLREPDNVWSAPLVALSSEDLDEFERSGGGLAGWPEVGSRMLTRLITGQDMSDGWVIVQSGSYRYTVTQAEGILVRTVLFEYLATEVHWPEY